MIRLKTMKKIILRILRRAGYKLERLGQGYWDVDKNFLELYKKTIRTVPDKKAQRTYVLYQFAKLALTVPGDVAEVGVYKGDTAKMLAEIFKNTEKKIKLYDTFEGLPGKASPLRPQTTFADTSIEEVKEYLKDYPMVSFYKGRFPDSVQNENSTYCLVHLDADIAETIKTGLEYFYPKMTPMGIIVIDDYRSKIWPEVTAVADKFAKEHNNHILHLAGAKGVIIKKA